MAIVEFRTAATNRPTPEEAAEDLVRGLDPKAANVVAIFADSEYDQPALNAALRERLPRGTKLFGSTTMAPVSHAGFQMGHVVAAAIGGPIEVGLGLGKGLGTDPAGAGAKALTQACQQLGVKPSDLDPRRHVAVVIDDGYRFRKEEFLVGMLDVNPSITLIGGGASHRLFPPEGAPLVHVGDEVVGDAVAVALFRIDAPWAALRHHAYAPTGGRVVITKIDDTARRALEIDGKPAAARYAELAGVGIDEIESKHAMWHLSTAMKVGREYFMRAPWKPLPDGSILFANLLTENMELELMKLGDMPQMLDDFIRNELPARVAAPQGMLFFDCAGRGEIIQASGTAGRIGEALGRGPRGAGLSACFELCNGFQINSTMTALAFGGNDA